MSVPPLPPPPGSPEPMASAPGPAARTGGSRLGLKIGGAVVGLALIGGAAFGAYTLWENTLGGGGAQPADVLPSSTVAYLRLDLDPSASQKISLLNLIDRVPEVKHELGLEDVDSQADLREVAFTEWFGLDDACGVDYDDDVKPWIGERAGLALVGDFDVTDDESEMAYNVAASSVLVVQVTDEDKAREGIVKLADECGIMQDISDDLEIDADEPGIVFRDGFALVTIDQDAADAIDAKTDQGTLAGDNEMFSDDMDALGEDGIISGWYDQKTLTAKIDEALEQFDEEVPPDFDDFLDAYEMLESSAFTLRATDETLEVAGTARLDHEFDLPDAESLAGLPGDTLLGLSVIGGGRLADRVWESVLPLAQMAYELETAFYSCPDYDYAEPEVEPSPAPTDPDAPTDPADPDLPPDVVEPPCVEPPTFDEMLEQFEDASGLSLPDDLETLFGQELNIYIGSEDIEDLQRAQSFEDALDVVDAGVEMVSDGDIVDVLEKLIGFLELDLEFTETDDGAVIASNDDAAEKLIDDHELGGSETFSTVIDEHDQMLGGAYLDIAGLLDALKAVGAPTDEVDEFSFLRALGVTAWVDADHVVSFSAKLSFVPEKD